LSRRFKIRTIQQILKGTGFENNQVEAFWAKCYVDFTFFAEHLFEFDMAEYHREWYNLMEKYPRLCIMAFRGSGKTNLIAAYFIWKAVFGENLKFLVLSQDFEDSKKVLKIIKNMFADNEILKQFVPSDRYASWKATELTINNRCIFYCKTYGEGVRGLRIDYLLCDEAGQYEDKSIFWTAVSAVVQLNRGKIFVIGTPKSPIDLLHELKDNDEYYFEEYLAEKDGKVLWPQKYTLLPYDTETKRSLIKVRKEIGELPYQQEFLLKPISDANALFPIEYLNDALANKEKFLPFGKISEQYYLGYDITGGKLKGDFAVITVLGVTKEKKRLVKGLRFRATFEEQMNKLRKVYYDFKPVKMVVDATAIGEKQAKDVEQEFGGTEMLKITYEIKHKILMDLRREFERLNIVLPNHRDDDAYKFTQQLVHELSEVSVHVDMRAGQTTRNKLSFGKYDDCLFEGTLITTNKGQKPIEEIKIGDLVLTRKGFKKVTRAWLKSENAELYQLTFNDGRTLIGTSDHKIYTKEKGFITMDTMRNIYKPMDAIDYVCQSNLIKKPITEIKEQDIGVRQEDMDFYTEIFGNFITEKYLKDLRYITKMVTNPITPLKTLSACQEKNTLLNTINIGQKKEEKNKENGLIKLDHSQKNGIVQKKEKIGIRNIGKQVLETKENQLKNSVKYVRKNLQIIHSNSQENIAHPNANKKHLELETQKKLNHTGKVYDLTVEDEHEFFANGILVHNCVNSLAYANRASLDPYGQVSFRPV